MAVAEAGGRRGAGGVPLPWVVISAIVLAVGTALSAWLYFADLQGDLHEPTPLEVDEVAADPAGLATVRQAIERARARGGEVALTETQWNLLLFAPALDDPDRAVRAYLESPFCRIRSSQQQSSGWLNAVLLAQLYAAPEGLGLVVRAGRVGGVSISRTQGEWVRKRIERQLMYEWGADAETRAFAGLTEVRVEPDRVVLRYAPSTPPAAGDTATDATPGR